MTQVLRMKRAILYLLSTILVCGLSGCAVFGILAQAAPKIVPASYSGLKGKTVAIMVWVDPTAKTDWPMMPLDISKSLQQKLLNAQKDPDPDDLKGATFPVTPQSVVRFQEEHPEAELQPIEDTAKVVGVQRLIYIEVGHFQTRSDMTVDLYLGQLTANVKIVELENGVTKTGYHEDNFTVKFPEKAPEDGVINLGDNRAYAGTIDEFTTKLSQRFYKHEEERQPGE